MLRDGNLCMAEPKRSVRIQIRPPHAAPITTGGNHAPLRASFLVPARVMVKIGARTANILRRAGLLSVLSSSLAFLLDFSRGSWILGSFAGVLGAMARGAFFLGVRDLFRDFLCFALAALVCFLVLSSRGLLFFAFVAASSRPPEEDAKATSLLIGVFITPSSRYSQMSTSFFEDVFWAEDLLASRSDDFFALTGVAAGDLKSSVTRLDFVAAFEKSFLPPLPFFSLILSRAFEDSREADSRKVASFVSQDPLGRDLSPPGRYLRGGSPLRALASCPRALLRALVALARRAVVRGSHGHGSFKR